MTVTLLKTEQIRQAVVKTARMLARDKVEIRQRGGQPHVRYRGDGTVMYVNLPMIPDNPSEEFLAAVQGFLDHEVAHVLFTNNKEFRELSEKAKKEGMDPKVVHSFANIFEDVRIEKFMGQKFRGSAHNLNESLEFVIERIIEPAVKKALTEADPSKRQSQIVLTAIVPWARAAGGCNISKAFLDKHGLWKFFEPLEKAFPDFQRRIASLVTSEDAAQLAYKFAKTLMPPPPPPAPKSKEKSKDKSEKSEEEGDKEEGEGASGESETDDDGEDEEESEGSGSGAEDEAPEEEGEEEDHGDDDTEEGDERGDEPDAGEKPGDEGGDGDDAEEEEDDAEPEDDDGEEPEADAGEGDEDAEPEEENDEGEDADAGGEAGDEGDEDEEGEAGGIGSGGDDEEEEGEEEPEPEGEGEDEGEPLDEELAEAIINGAPDTEDMDGMLAKVIESMIEGEFTGSKFIEYTRDYDKIARIEPDAGADVDGLERLVERVSATMQKDLQRIITARSQSTMVPGYRSGRINPSALHRLEVLDPRVFRRKHENNTKDVAVQLVVDCSGSMSGDKIQLAIQSAWAFASVLDKLKITNEVIGFTTLRTFAEASEVRAKAGEFAGQIGVDSDNIRWEPLHLPIFKEFGERFTLEQKRRFATAHEVPWWHKTLCQNIDGASILAAGMRLLAQKEKRKLMIVFSDGQPAAGMDMGSLWEHLRQAVQMLESNGVETIGVGIQSPAVVNFYPKHFVVNTLEELPGKVLGELRAFLTK